MPLRPRMLAAAVAMLLAGAIAAPALAPPALASPNGVVVSEFQTRGASGGNDEFVELLNSSGGAVDISGWSLQGCAGSSGNPSNRTSVPDGTVLEAGDHFLFTNSGSNGYSGDVPGDATYGTGFPDFESGNASGLRIVDSEGAAIDGAGSPNSPCAEGGGLTTPTANGDENAFERADGGTADTDVNADDFDGPKAGNPENFSGDVGEPSEPPLVKIHDIQGDGQESPLAGQEVAIEGVVTGVDDEIGANFARTFPEDAGIFVQEEDADTDGNPNTSEGIFVGFVRDRGAYEPGDVVTLVGEVKEKFGFTMISEKFDTEPVKVGDAETPEPVTLDPTLAANQSPETRDYYETLEGMNVRLETGTANSGGTNKFGELFLTPGTERERVFRTDPAPDLLATDADAGAGDPSNPFQPEAPSTTLVRGDLFDRVDDVVGPFSYSFDNFKIMVQPELLPTITEGPTEYPYDGLDKAKGNEVRVASFNVENFLDDVDDPGKDDSGDLAPITAEQENAKRDRIADAIDRLLLRPDIVAVQEVEKKEILDELAAQLGGYTAYLEEGNDSRGIDVGFLVKDTVEATNVRQLGKTATNPTTATCSDVPGGLFDRPPLAVDIKAGKGPKALSFTVFSNHFSSKGAPDDCREAQADFVRDQVEKIEADGGEAIVAGDLNAFEDESALTTLEDGTTSLDNLWDEAPEEERYSFSFSGKLQTLDHILVTEGLQPRVDDFLYAHFDNDYFERDDADETGDGHKVSDHDPPVVTLSKKPEPGPPGGGKPGKPGKPGDPKGGPKGKGPGERPGPPGRP